VYFSGHGVQTERGNYLLPVQGDYQREADFDSQAVSLNYVLDQFRGSRAAGLVILDACRDNPFSASTRSTTRGLRREEPPNGLLIAYSTAQNQTAADGSGTNGLYTKHLAHFLNQKGLAVDEVFDQTAKQVKLETRGEQSPREDSDIRDKLYLNGAPQSAAAPASAAGEDLEALAWKEAQSLDTLAAYETFLSGYPGGRFAITVKLKIESARRREQQQADAAQREAEAAALRERAQTEAKAWQEAQAADTVEAYRAFIDTYAQSLNLKAAQRKLAAAEKAHAAREARERAQAEQQAFREAQALDTAEGWRHYLSIHGEGGNAKTALTKLEAAEAAEQAKRVAEAWRMAQQSDTVDGYEGFLVVHGTSSFASAAKQKLEAARARQPKYKVFRDCAECPEMVVLPAGSFDMGDLHGDGATDEKPVRTVRIAQPFAMGAYEVTQGQWKAVMGNNPSHFNDCGDRCPVEKVNWNEVQAFILKLNEKTGKNYRLPSEAEWEYACRAGGRQKYCGSDSADGVAWHNKNSGGRTHAVGRKSANGWGLHDLSGNVWEWVQDCYEGSGYDKGQPLDGRAHEPSTSCAHRVNRGGGWGGVSSNYRSADRGQYPPDVRGSTLGFRLSRTLP